MPSTFEDLLRLELQATGENQNTWGTKTNNNLELLADAIAGHVSVAVAGSGNYTLTTSNAATDEARRAFITLSGLLTGNRSIIIPSTSKTYIFRRNTTGAFDITVKTVTGTGVTLPSSGLAVVVCDGTETYSIAVSDFLLRSGGSMTSTLSFVDGTSALPGITFASDQDTGIIRSGANTIQIIGGASTLLTLASTGVTFPVSTPPIWAADPSADNHLVRRLYIDNLINSAPVSKGASVTVSAADFGTRQAFLVSATTDIMLPALAGVSAGRSVEIWNVYDSSFPITVSANGSELINARTSLQLFPAETCRLVATPTRWLVDGIDQYGYRHVATKTASSSATIDFVLPPGFTSYRFELRGVLGATDGTSVAMRTSTDGGATYDSGATDYTNVLLGTSPLNGTSGTVTSLADNTSTDTTQASIDFYPGDGSRRPFALLSNAYLNNTGPATDVQVRTLRRNAVGPVNAVRFLMSSGNIASGTFTLLARY